MTIERPDWLKIRYQASPNRKYVERVLNGLSLNTVCREASCPNYLECFDRKTATFMILGKNCTRNCRFCNVNPGPPEAIDVHEPENIAKAVAELGLQYVVITTVTRDDLEDSGAEHFAQVITAIQSTSPETAIEVLISDLKGDISALQTVVDALPTVISHNMETVPSLYYAVRPQAIYQRSLDVLKNIKLLNPKIKSKTGIMLGLGEKEEEVIEEFNDLRKVGCEILTLGQYLAPSKEHHPVVEYIHPNQFEEYKNIALDMGFSFVASGPYVRSSYHADEAMKAL